MIDGAPDNIVSNLYVTIEKMTKEKLEYVKALNVAIHGLRLLKDQDPIARKTLEEIEKICSEIENL